MRSSVGAERWLDSQVRRGDGVLFSSAVHIHVGPECVASALPLASARRRRLASHLVVNAASLADVAGRPISAREVVDSVRSTLSGLHGVRLRDGAWPTTAATYASTVAL